MTDDSFQKAYRESKAQVLQMDAPKHDVAVFEAFLDELFSRLLKRGNDASLKEDGISIVKANGGLDVAAKSEKVKDKYVVILIPDRSTGILRLHGLTTGVVDLVRHDLETAEALFAEILGIETARANG